MAKQNKALAPYLSSTDQPDLSAIDAFLAQPQTPAEEPSRGRSFARMGADAGISLLKGAIAIPEAAVGLADIATGGRVGRLLENEGGTIGFRPRQARMWLDEQYSPEQQESFRRVQQADGLVDTAVEAVRNPSVIAHSVLESVPSIGAGGVMARGALAALPRMGGAVAGALGEGTVSAGQMAEHVRQESADGLLTPQQAAIAGGSGALTTGLGLAGGRLAQKLGIADIDTLVAGAARDPVAAKGVVRRVLQGAAAEGLLEELPQSVQEQVAQNAALGKPLDEGVDQAAVLGTLSGGALGAAANLRAPSVLPAQAAPTPSGPMGRAVDAGMAWEAVNVPPPAPIEPALAPTTTEDGIPFEADQRFAGRPIYPNGAAPAGEQFGSREAADIALGEQGLMASHGVQETAPGVFEIRPSAAPDMRMLQPGIYEDGGQPSAEARTPLAMPSAELLRAGVDPVTGELPPPAPPTAPPATPAAPGELPTMRAEDGSQRALFGSEQEARDYISQVRRQARNGAIREVPVERPDGTWTLAKPGEAGYEGAAMPAAIQPDGSEADVLNAAGQPFTTRRGALVAAKAKGDGWAPVKVDGGFIVRKAPMQAPTEVVLGDEPAAEQSNAGAPATAAEGVSESQGEPTGAPAPIETGETAPAEASGEGTAGAGHEVTGEGAAPVGALEVQAPSPIEGEKINRSWSAFAPESGSLGIPREQMPQVKAEHRGALVRFLNARGVQHEAQEVPAVDLKPTQAEFSPGKVKQAAEFSGGDRAILVSSDGYVLDGHHQWLAKREAGESVKVLRLNAPINDLLRLAHQFPSSTTAKGAPRAPANVAGGAPAEAGAVLVQEDLADATEAPTEQAGAAPAAAEATGAQAPAAAREDAGEQRADGLPAAGPADVQAVGVEAQAAEPAPTSKKRPARFAKAAEAVDGAPVEPPMHRRAKALAKAEDGRSQQPATTAGLQLPGVVQPAEGSSETKDTVFSRAPSDADAYVMFDGKPDLWTVPQVVEQRTGGRFVSAPVRLKVGRHSGPNRGFGLEHIDAEHHDEIAALGLAPAEYVQKIVSGATKVYDPGDGRLLIVNERFGKHQAIVELRRDGDHYSVITAFARAPQGKVVWSGRSTAASRPGTKPSVTGQSEPDGSTPAAASSADASAIRATGEVPVEPPKPAPSSRIADQTSTSVAPDGEKPQGDAAFSHGQHGAGVAMRDARAIVATIREVLPKAPPIHLHEKVSQAPRALAAQIRAIGGERTVHAAFHDGEIHAFPGNVASIEDLQFIIAHHEIRHYGMRSMLGPRLGPVMLEIFRSNETVRAAADEKMQKGLATSRVEAVEEALADMPVEQVAKTRGLGRLAALLRSWLRSIAAKFRALGMASLADRIDPAGWSDADVARFVLKAEDISRSGGEQYRAGGTVFDREPAPGGLGAALASAVNDAREVKLPAGYVLGDLFNNASKRLNWWHKTVGTMYNLAQRDADFRAVYNTAQAFVNDTSFYATEAADLAPTMLPKLEKLRDIGRAPLSAADTKAISAPIFEGTLTWGRDKAGKPVRMDEAEKRADSLDTFKQARDLLQAGKVTEAELKRWQALPIDSYQGAVRNRFREAFLKPGVVWTDDELRSMFKLNGKQIGLYKEFRAAVDRSLKNLATSDMLRYAGDDAQSVREAAMAAPTVEEAGTIVRDRLAAKAAEDLERADVLNATASEVIAKADKAKDLMARGYAPLSRFGRFTVYATEGEEQLYFGMFESQAEANRMARRMRANYPAAKIEQGTVSEAAYKLFAGVSPETVELFGEMLGLESGGDGEANKAFQDYLKLARSNRSAMKRLIERKGIAGFSEDAGRVLAGFVYSNGRQTASNLHMGELTDSIGAIPKAKGELKDHAVDLGEYLKNPVEEAQAIRGLMFAQFLGGSVASALVNMSQPVTVTFPWLSQYGGVRKAAAQMAAAMRDAARATTGDAKLDAALKLAEEQGVVAPQEVHQLMDQAGGKSALKAGDGTALGDAAAKASNALSKFSLAWGKLFGMAEVVNRRVTFIAAYRTAVDQGMPNPAEFAKDAISQTQFVYNKANKPAWARGAVGSTLFTFKQYSISYLELLSRMAANGPEGRKAALLAVAMLFLLGGADGLPFADDADDVIDGILQRLGYNFDSKRARREFLANVLGEDGAQFVAKGMSGLPGAPIDVSGRLGMGNLIPGTGLLTKKADHGRDIEEIAGPVAGLARKAAEGADALLSGDLGQAAAKFAPVAGANMLKALDMAATGMYRDDRGRKVLDVDGYDTLMKGIGFQPRDVARVQDATGMVQSAIAQNKLAETEFADRWAKAVFDGDQAAVAEVRADIATWNERNPESPIRVTIMQINRRVRAMRQDKATRIAKTAPREIRASIKEELAAAR